MTTQVGELVVMPNLLKSKVLALLFVPGEVKVQAARILAAVRFGLGLLRLQLSCLRGFGGDGFLLGFLQLSGGDEHWQVSEPVLCRFVSRNNEDFGIEVSVGVAGDLLKLQRVFVAVVGDDVDVRARVRQLRLDADEAAGHMAAVENPVHRISTEYGSDFLLSG